MEKISQAKREKDIRHARNLAGFTGYWHGIYYLLGTPQVKKLLTRSGKNSIMNSYGYRANTEKPRGHKSTGTH